MAGKESTSFTQSQLLSSLVTLYQALQEYLLKFSQSSDTDFSESTSFTWADATGDTHTMNIPSIGYIKSDITNIKDQLESLISNNDDTITLKYKDGTVKSFEMQKISKLVDILNNTGKVQFNVPSQLKYKNNWMFESFLNPLLVLPVDVSSLMVDNEVKKFSVRRIILNSPDDTAKKIFSSTFLNNNDLDYNEAIAVLNNYGIKFNIDDNEYELASAINAKRGNFSIIKKVNVTNNSGKAVYYELDKLYYVNVLTNNSSGYTQLNRGDILLTSDDTEYLVEDVQESTRLVSLKRIFGHSPIAVGVNMLKIKPEAYRVPELQINVGYNEYELIFVKPISTQLDLTTDQWTKGFGIYTNYLNIQLNNGATLSLPEYYDKYVSDFGMVLLNSAKEKEVPAAIGIKPDAPMLSSENLKVTCINKHVSDSDETSQIQSQMNAVSSAKQEISGYNDEINAKKASINADNATVESTMTTQKEIAELIEKKRKSQTALSTALASITNSIQNGNNVIVSPKYRIRGFVPVPDAKIGEYGKQEVIQMVVSYRYKSTNGSSTNNNTMTVIDTDGNKVTAYFPQWTEVRSPLRHKIYNDKLGIYEWAPEDISDSNVEHINQIDIPITRGEIVDIRVKSVSEAGYPSNPLESDWSDVVSISFPAENETSNESEYLAEQYLIENSLSEFNQELISNGVYDHIEDSIYINDRYFAHNLDNIYYGFATTSSTRLISAKEKIEELERRINDLSSSVTTAYGSVYVTIHDLNNNKTVEVTNNSTITFENLYSKSNGGYNGNILSNTYTVTVSNPSSTFLELVSMFGDGTGVVPSSYNDEYNTNLKYDKVPMNIFSKKGADYDSYMSNGGFQSQQIKNQFVFFRYNDLEGNPLYSDGDNTIQLDGCTCDGRKIYIAGNPQTSGNENLYFIDSTSKIHKSNGTPTSFCVSGDMPKGYFEVGDDIIDTWNKAMFPAIGTEEASYMKFFQTVCMSIPEGSDDFLGTENIKSYQQNAFFSKNITSMKTRGEGKPENYNDKICFDPKIDKYLIGKYTCGMYLYPNINKYGDITVDDGSKKLSMNNSISFDIKAQYRLTDRRNYVAGDTTTEKVSYRKKLGVDIFKSSNSAPRFSFDIDVKCFYE